MVAGYLRMVAAADAPADDRAFEGVLVDAVINELRRLHCELGKAFSRDYGAKAAADTVGCRSLPSIAEVLQQLWLEQDMIVQGAWDTKDEVVWASRLLAIQEGARKQILSFYGAGILIVEAVQGFALQIGPAVTPEVADWPSKSWLIGITELKETLQVQFQVLQVVPAGRQCSKLAPILGMSSNTPGTFVAQKAKQLHAMIPQKVQRSLGLKESGLTRTQIAGMGALMVLPGGWTLAATAVGTALVVDTVKNKMGEGENPLEQLQKECLQEAHRLLKQKTFPIQIRYEAPGIEKVKICLYHAWDALAVVPIGGPVSENVATLRRGESTVLRPNTKANVFLLKCFQPALFDKPLHAGVEIKRGDNIVLSFDASGTLLCQPDDDTGLRKDSGPVIPKHSDEGRQGPPLGPPPQASEDAKTLHKDNPSPEPPCFSGVSGFEEVPEDQKCKADFRYAPEVSEADSMVKHTPEGIEPELVHAPEVVHAAVDFHESTEISPIESGADYFAAEPMVNDVDLAAEHFHEGMIDSSAPFFAAEPMANDALLSAEHFHEGVIDPSAPYFSAEPMVSDADLAAENVHEGIIDPSAEHELFLPRGLGRADEFSTDWIFNKT